MTAPNHALTGAIIGAVIPNPWLALPLAFLSHFVLDALPHYDVPGDTDESRINSRLFLQVQIIGGFVVCAALVAAVWVVHPADWFVVCLAAFLGASPDLLSVPRFLDVKRNRVDPKDTWWFWRFHGRIQWKTGPWLWIVELVWAIVSLIVLWKIIT